MYEFLQLIDSRGIKKSPNGTDFKSVTNEQHIG